MRDTALQLFYLVLPVTALVGGFALLIRAQLRLPREQTRFALACTLLTAAATVAFVLWFLYSMFSSRSSTAGIGIIFLPGYALAVAGGAWFAFWSLLTLIGFAPAAGRYLGRARPGFFRMAVAIALLAGGAWEGGDYLLRNAALERAASAETPAQRLAAMAEEAMREGDFRVLERIAANRAAGADLLEDLHADCRARARAPYGSICYTVYISIGHNRAAGPGILAALAEEPTPAIRAAVARNESSPAATLEALARDPETSVRASAASNGGLPRAALERLARDPVPQVKSRAEAMLKQRGGE